MLDRIQAKALTRPALTPASSVIRGLSTTARISSPTGVNRNSSDQAADHDDGGGR